MADTHTSQKATIEAQARVNELELRLEREQGRCALLKQQAEGTTAAHGELYELQRRHADVQAGFEAQLAAKEAEVQRARERAALIEARANMEPRMTRRVSGASNVEDSSPASRRNSKSSPRPAEPQARDQQFEDSPGRLSSKSTRPGGGQARDQQFEDSPGRLSSKSTRPAGEERSPRQGSGSPRPVELQASIQQLELALQREAFATTEAQGQALEAREELCFVQASRAHRERDTPWEDAWGRVHYSNPTPVRRVERDRNTISRRRERETEAHLEAQLAARETELRELRVVFGQLRSEHAAVPVHLQGRVTAGDLTPTLEAPERCLRNYRQGVSLGGVAFAGFMHAVGLGSERAGQGPRARSRARSASCPQP